MRGLDWLRHANTPERGLGRKVRIAALEKNYEAQDLIFDTLVVDPRTQLCFERWCSVSV